MDAIKAVDPAKLSYSQAMQHLIHDHFTGARRIPGLLVSTDQETGCALVGRGDVWLVMLLEEGRMYPIVLKNGNTSVKAGVLVGHGAGKVKMVELKKQRQLAQFAEQWAREMTDEALVSV